MTPTDNEVWRCDVTGNPVGTDTVMIGAPPCSCQGCRAEAAIKRAQEAVLREMTEKWECNWGSEKDWLNNIHDFARDLGISLDGDGNG